MTIDIKTKNLELTATLKNFIEKKIGGLKKFIGKTLAEIFILVERETRHHKKGDIFLSQAEIILPEKKIIARSEGDNLLLTIVEIKDKLQQEIKKYKLKKIESPRRIQRKIKNSI